jgi:hypothetical protein
MEGGLSMTANRPLAHFFTAAALLGATSLFVGTALHPMGADPNDAAAAFSEYALDRYWIWSHLAQFVGVVLLALALITFTLELEIGQSAPWGGITVALAVALIAIAAALQAVDGVALKRVVDHWAAAAAEQKSAAFEAAFAVRQVELGLAGFLSLVTGLAIVAFGLTLHLSPKGSQWFAFAAVANGAIFVASGVAQQTTGFSAASMVLSMTAGLLFMVWIVALALFTWLRGGRLAPGGAHQRAGLRNEVRRRA